MEHFTREMFTDAEITAGKPTLKFTSGLDYRSHKKDDLKSALIAEENYERLQASAS